MTPYYDDGQITIYCGDCREVMRALDTRVELVITDPPYSSGARRDADKQVRGASMLREVEDADWFSHDTMTAWGYSWFLRGVLMDLRGLLAGGAHVYVFSDWRQTPNVYGMLESTGYRVNHCLVWAKDHFGLGTYWRNQHEHIVFASLGQPSPMRNRGMGSVLNWPGIRPEARLHPTEKPIGLIQRMLDAVPGDVVCDPFMGSGAVILAARNAGRQAIGIEIDEQHCATAVKRLAQQVLPLEVP